ncbi:hypothetical protein GDO78_012978 [Eleutherodactylus coqui]|uniref:Uncharacterized protein n=1 Tax=Eleutherodactylus coqui TaxID=57060 RepID=A0A8J6EZN1_ELECQ|nr:hypothetical protein GDO78_012978 [Eleutherodactylus coqui]
MLNYTPGIAYFCKRVTTYHFADEENFLWEGDESGKNVAQAITVACTVAWPNSNHLKGSWGCTNWDRVNIFQHPFYMGRESHD